MKKKCVLILSRFPSPPIGGYKLKTYYLVKILHEIFDLTIIVITDEKTEDQHIQFLENHSKEFKIFTFPKIRFYYNALKGLFLSKRPIQVEYYNFDHLKNKISPYFENAEVIIPSLTRTYEYVLNAPETSKIIFDEVDSYALSYERSKNKTNSFFWKMLYRIESERLKIYEKNAVAASQATLLVNKEETEFWNQYGKCYWLPNGVTPSLLKYPIVDSPENAIAFFGKMNYRPNIDAVKWYCKNVVKNLPVGMKFYIIGVYPTKEVLKLAEVYENVEVTGFMEDPYELMNRCLAIVSPMQTGGGLQNKVLDGMALGKVNILSTLAAKPIGGKDRKEFLIADSPEEHLKHLKSIISNSDLRTEIEKNARAFVKENFSWDNYKNQLINLLK